MSKKNQPKWSAWVLGVAVTIGAALVYWYGPSWIQERMGWGGAYLAYFLVVAGWLLLLFLASQAARLKPKRKKPPCTCQSDDCTRCEKRPDPVRCRCCCQYCKACDADHHGHAVEPLFAALWCAWVALVVWFEFLVPGLASVSDASVPTLGSVARIWFGLILWFVVLEVYAIAFRGRPGDTFSEQVWAFIHYETSRAGIAVGLILLLIVRIVELGAGHPTTIVDHLDLGRVMLGLGFGGWVVYHFVDREIERRRP